MSTLIEDGETTPLLRSSIRLSFGSPTIGKRLATHKTAPISTTLRWTTNLSALVGTFMFSGIVFGWAPLKLILLREGQYDELCDGGNVPCVAQMSRYNLIFTSAQFFLSLASLPVGFFLDNCSKTAHYGLAALLQVSGLLMFGLADSKSSTGLPVDPFVLGYTLIAVGGCMSMLGAFPSSFLLPKYQAGILAAISCLFDASSIVFAVFAQLNAKDEVVFSRRNMFTVYSLIAAVVFSILALCWVALEKREWKLVAQAETLEHAKQSATSLDDYEEIDDDEDDEGKPAKQQTRKNPGAAHARRVQDLDMHDWRLTAQLQTFEFVVALSFAAVHMLRCNFYIQSVNEILLSYGDYDAFYANVFSFVLPLGVVFVPIIEGTITRVGVVNTLHFSNGLGVLFGILLLVPSLHVQAVNFVVFTGFRAFLYATLNTFTAATFGVSTMGRMIGFTFTTASLVTLLQYPAATWALDKHGGDFSVVNSILLAVCVLPIPTASMYSRMINK